MVRHRGICPQSIRLDRKMLDWIVFFSENGDVSSPRTRIVEQSIQVQSKEWQHRSQTNRRDLEGKKWQPHPMSGGMTNSKRFQFCLNTWVNIEQK